MKKIISSVLYRFGYSKKQTSNSFVDIQDEAFWEIFNACKPYTMTSVERMYALYNSVNYVLDNNIQGDFVECGVWRGGSSMLLALALKKRNITDRKIYLFDTFEGMSEPTENDVDLTGSDADKLLNQTKHDKENSVWCLASLEDVQANLNLTKYPAENIIYVKGKVEDTIPAKSPQSIALLRLDTDWYESTKHELIHLYPLLRSKGVMIIDDYGHWAGCRKATDEYFQEKEFKILLNRIDYTGRLMIKP